MPRPASTAMLAASSATQLEPAFFVLATFATGPVYLWTGLGSLSWNGHTWLGVGSLGGISMIDEGSTVEAKGIVLSLSGIDTTLLPDVMTELVLGLPVAVYLGLFNGGSLIASPFTAWAGRMDQPTVDVDGTHATISIACENRLVDMNSSPGRRYTNDDQQRYQPGDLGFSFVNSIQEITLFWGSAPTTSGTI